MAKVTDIGGKARLRAMFARVQEAAESALAEAGKVIATEVALRAPSPQMEFEVMMYGEGNPYAVPEDVSSSAFGEDDDGDGRARFIKPEPYYLQNWMPLDYHPDGLFCGVGWIPDLDIISQYQWKNRGGTHESPIGFFMAWELGGEFGSFTITPRDVSKNGHPYPLRPSIEKNEPPLFEMTKTIPRMRMFGSVDLGSVVEQVVIPKLKQAARET